MRSPLPIDVFLPEISEILSHHQNLVVAAEPGAGKTTRLPPALLPLVTGQILVLEPRRMAVIAACERIAAEQSFEVGREIGYQVRFDHRLQKETRLIFMTEALLTRRLLSDPELKGVGAVVLDEFHERSLHVDLALGLLKELQQMGHPLKIIVMSATLDIQRVQQYLPNCGSIAVPGQTFPLQLIQLNRQLKTRWHQDDFKEFAQEAKNIFLKSTGDLLVFLPGQGEIERIRRILEPWSEQEGLPLLALHGSIPLEAQRAILAPSNVRRIILSTNVAESSVTVEGVRTVFDSGLVKVLRQDSRTGFSRLEIQKVSRASATQRSGRAARQSPGTGYRWWSAFENENLAPFEKPEILRVDLSECLLFLSAQGISDFSQFSWFESPEAFQLNRACRDLIELEALTADFKITTLGKELLRWPLPPSLSKLMVTGQRRHQLSLAADLAALLLEKDILKPKTSHNHLGDQWECDLTLRWTLLNDWRQRKSDQDLILSHVRNVEHLSRQLKRETKSVLSTSDVRDEIAALLLSSFPHRLCRRRNNSDRAAMVGGRGARLDSESVVVQSPFFLALEVADQDGSADSLISVSSGLTLADIQTHLKSQLHTRERAFFDEKTKRFLKVKETCFRDLPLNETQPKLANPDDIHGALLDYIKKNFAELQKLNDVFNRWLSRWRFYTSHGGYPPLTEEQTRLALEQATYGCSSVDEVLKKDWVPFFESQLEPQALRTFHREVPAKITVPSGSQIEVQYPEQNTPFIEVRLQEIFGWTTTPKILHQKVPLVLSLLAPNFRPVQTTSDLASFWNSGYFEVRKELRQRYPKHSWPEDPLSAKAEAKGRRRQ